MCVRADDCTHIHIGRAIVFLHKQTAFYTIAATSTTIVSSIIIVLLHFDYCVYFFSLRLVFNSYSYVADSHRVASLTFVLTLSHLRTNKWRVYVFCTYRQISRTHRIKAVKANFNLSMKMSSSNQHTAHTKKQYKIKWVYETWEHGYSYWCFFCHCVHINCCTDLLISPDNI